jgi:hypothetical protein
MSIATSSKFSRRYLAKALPIVIYNHRYEAFLPLKSMFIDSNSAWPWIALIHSSLEL